MMNTPTPLASPPTSDPLFLGSNVDVDDGLRMRDGDDGRDGVERKDVMVLSAEDVLDVLARQTTVSVTCVLADGHTRTTREPYVLVGDELYLPSSANLGSFISNGGADPRDTRRTDGPRAGTLECEVNDLDGLSEWRYVWLRGCATLLQPTGGASERGAWRTGIEQLREVVPRLRVASLEALAFSNVAVIRLANLEPTGVWVNLGNPSLIPST